MMKNTFISLSITLLALITLAACDSKEVVALAVESQNMSKVAPVKVGACSIDSINYNRDENHVAINLTIIPLSPDTVAVKQVEQADAMQETDILLRTSELTKLLVAMVNANATLNLSVSYGESPAVNISYTPKQLKSLYEAAQFTANEYAAQSIAINLAILTKACPIPFIDNTMTLHKAAVNDSIITYEISPLANQYSEIAASQASFHNALLHHITVSYNQNPGWQTLIKTAWELENTLRFIVKDPSSARSVTFDFPARASLYWIINPK